MSQELNLNLLKLLEREIILDVLYRDQILRKVDEERVRYVTILQLWGVIAPPLFGFLLHDIYFYQLLHWISLVMKLQLT